MPASSCCRAEPEIFRVDETVERITRAYGVESCSSFVLSSGLFTTAGNQQEEYFAKVRHVPLSSAGWTRWRQ